MTQSTTDPTPTKSGIPFRSGDFASLPEALDYAATGTTGINVYSGRGALAERLPYTDLRDQARDLARRLIGAGLAPGERVALLAETDGDFVRAFMACQYAGLVPAPMPLPAAFGGRATYLAHLRRMIQSADATAAFAPTSFRDWLAEAVDGLDLAFAGTVSDLADREAEGDLPQVGPDDIAYLQFSSGSTRFPVGVAVTQRALRANVEAISRHGLEMRAGDRCTSWLPMYHDMGLVGFLLVPLMTQVSLDLMATRDFARRPFLWLKLITENGGTLSFSPNFGYELCLRRAKSAPLDGIDLSSWRAAGLGGDMIRPSVLEDFARVFGTAGFRREAFVPSYGMAEATLALSFQPLNTGPMADELDLDRLENDRLAVAPSPDTKRSRAFAQCGPILPGHEIAVLDEDDAPLPDLHVGRVRVRGPSLMKHYYGQPEQTAAALSDDGWLETGDLGYLRDGALVITGRAKDLIIVNGRNIWPQDLEWSAEHGVEALRAGDAAAVARDDDGGEERVVMLIQCRSADADARAALAADVAAVLAADHSVEAEVVLVPHNALPHTSSGKLSRSKSRKMLLDGAFDPTPAG
ncbi:MAG: fatty acyl-AMP ligase [Pseudomonadota bacterium]